MQDWRKKLYITIFEAETPQGKAFDVGLIVFVVLSIITVMLESVDAIRVNYAQELIIAEWVFTILFSVEYILRLVCVHRPIKYAFSFFGLVDFFSIAPTYLSIFIPGAQSFLVIRALRLLRVFSSSKTKSLHNGG